MRGSMATPNWTPDPGGRGSTRRPIVAMNGLVLSGELRPVMFVLVLARITSSASPGRLGHSMQIVVVSRKSAPIP